MWAHARSTTEDAIHGPALRWVRSHMRTLWRRRRSRAPGARVLSRRIQVTAMRCAGRPPVLRGASICGAQAVATEAESTFFSVSSSDLVRL